MLPNSFIAANLERLEAEDGRQDLIDSITDVIGYKGERRRRFLQRLEKLPYRQLVETVYRYWRQDRALFPDGWHIIPADVLEAQAADSGPRADARNMAARFKISLGQRSGRVTATRKKITAPRIDKYAVAARECRERNGGTCADCRRLNIKGYCWKWGLYTERPAELAEAAAF